MARRKTDAPRILFLSFEPSLRHVVSEFLKLEDYVVTHTHTARAALSIVRHASGAFVVLADNYQVSAEARSFARTLFAQPELHGRVRLIGIGPKYAKGLIDLDVYIAMPFTLETLLDPIAQACAELGAL